MGWRLLKKLKWNLLCDPGVEMMLSTEGRVDRENNLCPCRMSFSLKKEGNLSSANFRQKYTLTTSFSPSILATTLTTLSQIVLSSIFIFIYIHIYLSSIYLSSYHLSISSVYLSSIYHSHMHLYVYACVEGWWLKNGGVSSLGEKAGSFSITIHRLFFI